jgi:hypothetical protein
MPQQPSFTTPIEAIEFIRLCLQQNDPAKLYAAFSVETREFWKDIFFQDLHEIQNTETLKHVFLEHARITAFPEQEMILHLGGHDPRTHHLYITLSKTPFGWVLESILKSN